ncbi:sensor histidine kinase [Grimontia hollisae]|uniref:sensor histidine kinase n=1 Tax=Grimontia hollisae TaxID=673 RepID=UPI00130303BE|nr:hybrid sensor histidine kinase/response regulator [Grimontia hollisae]
MTSLRNTDDKAPVIAVVDDSVTLCEMLCELLNDEGYQTQAYFSGAEALEGIKANVPDLVLLDIDMPDIDGFEVCARLKENQSLVDIPVLFISSYNKLDDKLKAFDYGALDYVTKPIHFAEVKARIKTHLSLRHYQQALEARNDELAETLNQLKAAQQQLVQADKLASLGQLTAGVAHEINNPISFIVGNGHSLIKRAERLRQYLKMVHADPQPEIATLRETLRIDDITQDLEPMVSDILEAAGRVSGIVEDLNHSCVLQAEKSEVVLNDVVALATKWVSANKALEQVIQLTPSQNIVVIGHKGQLVQVVVNLLNNAFDACKHHKYPKITVESGIDAPKAWLSITDNGKGINAADIGKIFDPFFTTKDVGKGTGLGLAISYRLVMEHHGDLLAENMPQGGARFTLKLPLGIGSR